MWLIDCGLDAIEWRRTVVVYSSALAPIILTIYLLLKNKMKRWIALTLISSFLIAAFGWEIWVNYGLVDGDLVNARRSAAMSCAIPMNINWLVNSLADMGIVWLGIILVYMIFPKMAEDYQVFNWSFLFIFFIWFMGQNFLVEAVIYHNQVGGDASLSWAPLMPFGPYYNPTLISFGTRYYTSITVSLVDWNIFILFYFNLFLQENKGQIK